MITLYFPSCLGFSRHVEVSYARSLPRFSCSCWFCWKFPSAANRKLLFSGTQKVDFSAPGLECTQLTPQLVKAPATTPLPWGQEHHSSCQIWSKRGTISSLQMRRRETFPQPGRGVLPSLGHIFLPIRTDLLQADPFKSQLPLGRGTARFSPAPAPELCRHKALTQQHQQQPAQGDRAFLAELSMPAGQPQATGWGRGGREGTSCPSMAICKALALKGRHTPPIPHSTPTPFLPSLISSCWREPGTIPHSPLWLFQLNRVTHDCFS